MFVLFALALGTRVVRHDAMLDLAANPHDAEITKDAEDMATLVSDAIKDVEIAESGDFSPDDILSIVKQVTTDGKMAKGIVHDVFSKGGLLFLAKQGLKSIKDKRKDFCWKSITRRPTVPVRVYDENAPPISCMTALCSLFRRNKKFLACPAGSKTSKLDKAWCHSECHGDLSTSCGFGCVPKKNLACTSAVVKDVVAGGRLLLDVFAIVFPTPLTLGLDVAVPAMLDSLRLVAQAVMAGLDDQDAHVKEAKFAAAMLAVLHHAGNPTNWAELESSALQVKDDVHVKEYAKRAFDKFKESIKDATSVVHLVYTVFHDSQVLQTLGEATIADTVAHGLVSITGVFGAFVAPTCKSAAPAERGPARQHM